jgi:hypothetical protein
MSIINGNLSLLLLNYVSKIVSAQGAREYMEDRYANQCAFVCVLLTQQWRRYTIVEHPHELHGVKNMPPTCYFGVFDGHQVCSSPL